MNRKLALTPELLHHASPALARDARVWAAFSGGLDSTVLLHLLQEAGLKPHALHVNHGLQAVAGQWAEHCRAVCTQWKVPFDVLDVQVDRTDPAGPEAAARAARYEALRHHLKAGDCLATAHHRDDQAETVLFRLLRGAGIAGLAAMRGVAPFAPGVLWRPLLDVPRSEIRAYAERHRLRWIEDPHNQDPRYARSWLRQEILPRLNGRWPAAEESLARTAAHCAQAQELLDEVAAQDLQTLRAGEGLAVSGLLTLSRHRCGNVLRHWLETRGYEAPPAETLARVESEVLRADPDAEPLLAWGDYELRRYRDIVFAVRRLPPAPDVRLAWDGRKSLELPAGCGRLVLQSPSSEVLPLSVAFPKGGERIRPVGGVHSRSLKNLFQENAVPPWLRSRMPLIRLDGRLVSVADRWHTALWAELTMRLGLRMTWLHELPGDPRRMKSL